MRKRKLQIPNSKWKTGIDINNKIFITKADCLLFNDLSFEFVLNLATFFNFTKNNKIKL